MDVKKIKELVELVESSDINELEVEYGARKIKIVKKPPVNTVSSMPMAGAVMNAPQAVGSANEKTAEEAADGAFRKISSPIVGTFYRKPAPDEPPFIDVGTVVKKGQVVCIIEAMKIFNEIKADISGKVVEVLVEDGHPVEYGQDLFLIDKE